MACWRPVFTLSKLISSNISRKQQLLFNQKSISIQKSLVSTSKLSMSDIPERGIGDGAEKEEAAGGVTAPKTAAAMAWEPDPEMLTNLVAMGISQVAAKKALFYTGNSSADAAASWIFENNDADLDTPLEVEASRETMTNEDRERARHTRDVFKMVFVINSSLNMGLGKTAAQVAHATLGVYQLMLQNEMKYGEWLLKWEEYGETKIVLRGQSTQQLVELEKKAMDVELPCYLVQDAGKTQVPAGSTTVLAVFGRVDTIDTVTGALRLL